MEVYGWVKSWEDAEAKSREMLTRVEAEIMVKVIAMRMTDILTDRVIVTGAEVCLTPWPASRGPTTRLTRT